MDTITTQGIRLPKLGLGTFRMQGADCQSAVESALGLGYRHIDTAEMYGNEAPIGDAIVASGVGRADLHVTTKVWHDHLTRDGINAAFDASLAKLKLEHVDLYLVHWPAPGMDLAAIFDTMMTLMDEGRVRAIGVCNFPVALLRVAIDEIKAPVACNQIEYHAMLNQSAVRDYLKPKGIPITAYCPLAQGRVADDPTLAAIGKKHDASAGAGRAQMAARSGRCRGDSEGLAQGKPAGQSRCVEDHAGRRGSPDDRGVAKGQTLRQPGLCAAVGLRVFSLPMQERGEGERGR